jgi:diguanylate cyclase (GGDEF)-like protein/PAS domain S-box-containing protein
VSQTGGPDVGPLRDTAGHAPVGEGLTRLTLELVGRLLEAADPVAELGNRGLATMGAGLAADHGVVVSASSDRVDRPDRVGRFVWWSPDVLATVDDATRLESLSDLPRTWELLARGQTVAITDVEALSKAWDRDRDYLTALGIRSAARAPVLSRGETIGAVGIGMVGVPRRWTDDELAALRLVAGVFGGALSRAQAEEQLHERDALFRTMITNSSDILVIITAEGLARFVSPAVERVLGHRADELIGRNFLEVVHPDDLTRVAERFIEIVDNGHDGDPMVLRVRHANGEWRWVEAVGSNLLDDPSVNAILVNLREVTERLEAERAISVGRERYHQLVESIPDVVIRLDRSLRPVYGNSAALRFRDAWREASNRDLVDFDRDATLAQTVDELTAVLESGESRSFELAVALSDGKHWFTVDAMPERGEEDEVTGVLTVGRDVTVYKQREQKLTKQALEDPLTGVANRTRFVAELERTLHGLSRNDGPVGVLFLDLDGFKEINDELGHAMGDRFLTAFAERLTGALRPSDLVARVGGDEFVVLPDRLRIIAELSELAARLHRALERPVRLSDHERQVTVSIGIAYATRPGAPTAAELLDRADQAMYRSKRMGPGQTSVWEPSD